jgi:hypothetical protein
MSSTQVGCCFSLKYSTEPKRLASYKRSSFFGAALVTKKNKFYNSDTWWVTKKQLMAISVNIFKIKKNL